MKLFNLKTLVVQSTLKVNVKQANVCTNGNAVGWLNKYVCRGGKNTIFFSQTLLTSNWQDWYLKLWSGKISFNRDFFFSYALCFCDHSCLICISFCLLSDLWSNVEWDLVSTPNLKLPLDYCQMVKPPILCKRRRGLKNCTLWFQDAP